LHDEIIKYSIEGVLDEKDVTKRKEELVYFLHGVMREAGVVPSIDLDPQFTLRYVEDKGYMVFILSVYGVYVGGEKAWQLTGIANGVAMRK
jgi:hypothetical protein